MSSSTFFFTCTSSLLTKTPSIKPIKTPTLLCFSHFTNKNTTNPLTLSSSHSVSIFAPRVPIALSSPNVNKQHPLTIVAAKGYKMKTHKASAKRFRVTGTGKIVRRRAGKQHLLRKKNAKRRTRLSKTVQVDRSDYNNVIEAAFLILCFVVVAATANIEMQSVYCPDYLYLFIHPVVCSRHMTGNRKLFSSYKAYNGGNVIFGTNLRGKICDNKCRVTFSEHDSESLRMVSPSAVRSYGGNRYALVIVDDYSRLVAQGYNQQEGIDYDETYALVARLESIRILLAYAYDLDFKLFQMDVKNAFLNGFINEEVYVALPSGFIDFEKPNHVYKLKKALYCLKQAPKAWYDRLKAFLIKNEYKMGMVDFKLCTKKKSSNLIIVQIYVDDIIFGSTSQEMCDEFSKTMHDEFEMSMMGELNFFHGLQIKQIEDGIFFNQSKYIKEILKKFGLEESKPMKTLMSFDTKLTKDEECESVDSTKYRGMIGSLLYLTESRPDIMFSVCLCARFEEASKTSHLEAVKRIF
nr:retrovirus-related Pol polyprotein from transposon TNT 1-94 [Tanacetum cinerariifolium]